MPYNNEGIYTGDSQLGEVTDTIYFDNSNGEGGVPPPFMLDITTEDNVILTTENYIDLTTEG